jgi:beta-barrel assembly-enhancing protease
LGLSYLREYETEADKVGVELMFKNKVNPEGMVLLLNKLKEGHNEGNSNKVDKYFLTHPLTSERIEAVKKLIILQKDTNFLVTSPDLLKYWTELKK